MKACQQDQWAICSVSWLCTSWISSLLKAYAMIHGISLPFMGRIQIHYVNFVMDY